MKRKRKTKEKTYVRMLAKFGWKNKNKWKETNIEGGGKKTKGQGGIAGRKGMMGIDSEYESMSMKRAEKSKTKTTRWKKQMKIRDRKGTGKQSWNQEKKNEFRQKKMNTRKESERHGESMNECM